MDCVQNWEAYSAAEHRTWSRLYRGMLPVWERCANRYFLDGVTSLHLDPDRIPRLSDVNRFLCPLTGFRAIPVAGYIPAFRFFDSLRNRAFPTTVTIRDAANLDYLPEPDIFHDVAGHVPMHTDPAFAEALVRFGDCAHTAAELAGGSGRQNQLASIIRAMARFFWFTVEFGLMQFPEGLKACGSGLLSSHAELEHALASPSVQRYPIQLEWVVNQSFEIDRFQPLLFYVESFDHLFTLVGELERWMKEGKLNDVAPGEPQVNAADIESFEARLIPS
jgi:phenylalanine-4-hydroxylase